MKKVPTALEIMAVYNVNQDVAEVATKFGWAPGYAKFMIDQAKRNSANLTASPVIQAPVPQEAPIEAETAIISATQPEDKAEVLDKELKAVSVPVAEVAINKDEKQPLAMLRTKVD